MLKNQLEEQSRKEFEYQAEYLSQKVKQSLKRYTDVLQGFKGFFKSSDQIDRSQFSDFFSTIRDTGNYPGLQAISFSQFVTREDKPQFEREVRKELSTYMPELPMYSIHPPSSSDYSFILKYTEPLHQNAKSLGFDLATEKQRRLSILRARDSGTPTATGRIQLLQDDKKMPAIAWRVPIYKKMPG